MKRAIQAAIPTAIVALIVALVWMPGSANLPEAEAQQQQQRYQQQQPQQRSRSQQQQRYQQQRTARAPSRNTADPNVPQFEKTGEPGGDLRGEFLIAEPLAIGESITTDPYPCKPGDVILFQIRYPVAPPFPKSVELYSDSGAAIPLDSLRGAGMAAYLGEEPQTSTGLGVSYLDVLIKAHKPGEAKITVEIKLSDGTTREIPFVVQVQG